MKSKLAVAGIVGEALFTAAWLTAGCWQGKGYRVARDDISDLGALTAPHAWWYLVPQAVAGLAVIAFALFALGPAVRAAGAIGRAGVWMAALSAVQDLTDAAFRLDCRAADGCTQAQATASWHGALHATTGLVCALLLVGAPFMLARAFRRLPQWHDLVSVSRWIGLAIVAGFAGVALPQTAPLHGLFQRGVALLAAGWAVVLALRLIKLARSEPSALPTSPHSPSRRR